MNHQLLGYELTMKVLYCSAIFLAMVCLCFAFLNAYDFFFRSDLPWKEGDFRAVMLRCIGGAVLFAATAIFVRNMLKKNL
ncbi:MAG: hypothetical protein V7695_14840 [Sulfitobacter sp.]